MRQAAKRDANEEDIVDALTRCGHLVQRISGAGVPDLLVFSHSQGRLLLLEVKDGAKIPSARKLTPAQQEWHRAWQSAPIYVVESIEEALDACNKRLPRV